MASTARIFFAGIGTTFLILAVGFGGGLLLAKSTLHDPPLQTRASSESNRSVRVILPTSAEPAMQSTPIIPDEPMSEVHPVKEVQAPVTQPNEKADSKMGERERRAERRRYAERKAKRLAAVRVRRQVEPLERSEPSIMAFGGDVSRTFGN